MARIDGFRRGGFSGDVMGAGLALVLALGAGGASAWGQAEALATRSTSAVYAMGGGENSQWMHYSDNALGMNLGLFVQPRKLVGGEVRAGFYPVSAKYMQSAFTAGARVGGVLGDSRWEPYGYLGVGGSRGQDQAANGNVMPAAWAPCWQAAIGLDMNSERFSLRLADISLRETYTPLRTVRTVGVNIGLVYRLELGTPRLR